MISFLLVVQGFILSIRRNDMSGACVATGMHLTFVGRECLVLTVFRNRGPAAVPGPPPHAGLRARLAVPTAPRAALPLRLPQETPHLKTGALRHHWLLLPHQNRLRSAHRWPAKGDCFLVLVLDVPFPLWSANVSTLCCKIFFSSFFSDIALDRLLLSTDSYTRRSWDIFWSSLLILKLKLRSNVALRPRYATKG